MKTETKYREVWAATSEWFEIATREGMEVDWDDCPQDWEEIVEATGWDAADQECAVGRLAVTRPQDTILLGGDYVVRECINGDYAFVRESTR